MRRLLIFPHGLGDCCQFTIALRHLRHYWPNDSLSVVAGIGKEQVFAGLADECFPLCHPMTWREQCYDKTLDVLWHRPTRNYVSSPSSKPAESLVNEFGLAPIPALFRYTMRPQAEAEAKAEAFLERIKRPFAFCHFASEVSSLDKGLSDQEAETICDDLQAQGLTPLILDMGRQCRSLRQRPGPVFLDGSYRPLGRWGDAQFLRSIIARARLAVGIDSGPSHVAAATETPTVVIWRQTVVPYCFDPAPNVLHLVPDEMPALMFAERRDEALAYFNEHYRSRSYGDNLAKFLQSGGLNRMTPILQKG